MRRIILVGCGARKRDRASTAAALYTGGLTRSSIAHAEQRGWRWFILSALHGLLEPSRQVAPYEHRLARSEASAWAERICRRLERVCGHGPRVYELHCGASYAVPLMAARPAWSWATPLAGLQVGQRLRWYARRRVSADAAAARAERSLRWVRRWSHLALDREELPMRAHTLLGPLALRLHHYASGQTSAIRHYLDEIYGRTGAQPRPAQLNLFRRAS